MKKLTTEEFIERAKNVHGNKYDYSLAEYKGTHEKIKIICPEHGIFEQRPCDHLHKQGCPYCKPNYPKTRENFLELAKQTHGDKYDYSNIKYVNWKTPFEIKCKTCGNIFKQSPELHISRKHGCPACGNLKSIKNRTKSKEQFIEEAKILFKDKYDYSKVNYIGANNKVEIVCKQHGSFFVTPHHHLSFVGCPICNCSHGEQKIRNLLIENGITFEQQYKFSGCKDINPLPFDFYLPELNIVIEMQGEQHYRIIEHFGGEEGFQLQQKHDSIKREFCRENNIKEIEIPYYENIEAILQKEGIILCK